MGLFDSVYVPCPNCGKSVEFQSKQGECYMQNFTCDDAPTEILMDIANAPHFCQACGTWVALIDPAFPPGPPPRPNLKAAVVKPPMVFQSHFQGFRWWPDDRAFSYDDLVSPISKEGQKQ